MKDTFYRIKSRKGPFYYNGYTNRRVNHTGIDGWFNVEDKINWDCDRFWACMRLETAKRHLWLIKQLEGLHYTDLVLEKVCVEKVEEVPVNDEE